jgi:hypothetical protein
MALYSSPDLPPLVAWKLGFLVFSVLFYRCKCISTLLLVLLLLLSTYSTVLNGIYTTSLAQYIQALAVFTYNTTSIEWMKWSFLEINQACGGLYVSSVVLLQILFAAVLFFERVRGCGKPKKAACARRMATANLGPRARGFGPLRRLALMRRNRFCGGQGARGFNEGLILGASPNQNF